MTRAKKIARNSKPMIDTLESRCLLSGTPATSTFTDNFTPAPSSQWDNNSGNWTAVNGQYYAQNPINTPFATSELKGAVGDFTLNVTANNVTDGGIWIHNDGTNQHGIILVLGGEGYGQGVRGGKAGNSIYWQAVVNGTGYVGGVQDEVTGEFVTGDNYQVTVTAVGDTYSAYVNGSTTPVTSYTTGLFPTGEVGLYDDQPNITGGGSGAPMTFSNFSLSTTSTAASLTPTIKGKLPAAVITGQKTPIRQSLTLTNTTGAVYTGSETVQWFLDTGTNLDSSAVPLTAAVTKTLKLKKNAHAGFGLAINTLPTTVPAGTYHLIAEVTDAAGSSVVASPTTIAVSAPVVSLSGTLGTIKNIKAGDKLTIFNSGNIIDSARFTQTVGFSVDSLGADTLGLSVTTVHPIKINPGKSAAVKIGVTKAQLASLTPGVSYYLTVTETDTTGHTFEAVSPVPFTIG